MPLIRRMVVPGIARVERRGRGLQAAQAAALDRDGRRAGSVAGVTVDGDAESRADSASVEAQSAPGA